MRKECLGRLGTLCKISISTLTSTSPRKSLFSPFEAVQKFLPEFLYRGSCQSKVTLSGRPLLSSAVDIVLLSWRSFRTAVAKSFEMLLIVVSLALGEKSGPRSYSGLSAQAEITA